MRPATPASPTTRAPADDWAVGIPQIVARHLWLVAAVVVIAAAAAATYLRLATPLYTSGARLLVEPNRPRLLDAAQPPVSADDTALFLSTQRAVLLSAPVLARAVPVNGANLADTIAALKDDLRVTVGRRDNVIGIEFDAPSAQQAAATVGAVIDAYAAIQSAQERTMAEQLLRVLQLEKSQCETAMAQKRAAILDVEHAATTVSFDGRETLLKTLQGLRESLIVAKLDAETAASAHAAAMENIKGDQERLSHLRELEHSGSGGAGPEADAAQARASIADLEQQLQELLRGNGYMPNHPKVRSLKMRLDHLYALQVLSLQQRAAATKAREQRLADEVAQQEFAVASFAGKGADYARLDGELKQLERHSESLDARMSELQAAQDAGAMNIRVLEPPSMESRPSRPSRWRVLAAALAGGLVLGTSLACVREWTNRRLRWASEARQALGLSVLAAVPRMPLRMPRAARAQVLRLAPLSPTAEAYRGVRTALAHAMAAGMGRRLLVTAAGGGQGASTMVSNLAVAIAAAGKRVLVVDAHLRRPAQHDCLSVSLRPGLANALLGDELPERVVQRTTMEGLDVIAAGCAGGTPPELLLSPRLADLLEQVGRRYDAVLVDAAPAGEFADAAALAGLCDAAVLVVRTGRADGAQAMAACDGLAAAGRPPLLLLNGTSRRDGAAHDPLAVQPSACPARSPASGVSEAALP